MTVTPYRNMTVGTHARAAVRDPRLQRVVIVAALLACSACSGLLATRRAPTPAATEQATVGRSSRRAGGPRVAVAHTPPGLVAEPPDVEPNPIASDSTGVARLVRLAEVWHTIALHHPWVATRGVPWDSALIIAAPRVRAATDDASLARAYRRFLGVLGDPVTRIENAVIPEPVAIAVESERTGDSIVVVRIAPSAPLDASDSILVASATARLPTRVLLDLRGTPIRNSAAGATRIDAFLVRTGLAHQLVPGTVSAPPERVRRIGVLTAVDPRDASREFQDGWQQPAERVYLGHAPDTRRIVILADSGTALPGVVLALLDAGVASLVADGEFQDASPVQRVRVPLSTGLVAIIRVGELTNGDGSFDVVPDTIIRRTVSSTNDHAFLAAMTLLRASTPLPLIDRPLQPHVLPAATPVFYDTTAYPFMGARLLAGFRLWSAMRARHAHRDLYDDDLDAVFERVIPRLEAARNAEEYAAGLVELSASLDDAQGSLRGASYDAIVGTAALPFRVRAAEGRVFISDVVGDSVTSSLQLVPGAEILAMDGFPTVAWLSEHRRMAPASNDWTRLRALTRLMSRGRVGDAMVRVRDVNNRERTLTVPRREAYREMAPTVERPSGAPTRTLSEGIGYVDVERLSDTTLDAALTTMAGMRGIVLDLRGRLAIDDTRLLRRLASKPRAMVGRVVQRSLTAPCFAAIREAVADCPDARETHPWWRTVDTTAVLGARLVALIDERTQGSMERFALSLEQMSAVTFVGSASAGALSWVTPLSLPGGLTVGIAAQEVRRADGGQVQRLGLNPGVDVRPTARGLRAGDDEVLNRAQQWLQQQLAPTRRRR